VKVFKCFGKAVTNHGYLYEKSPGYGTDISNKNVTMQRLGYRFEGCTLTAELTRSIITAVQVRIVCLPVSCLQLQRCKLTFVFILVLFSYPKRRTQFEDVLLEQTAVEYRLLGPQRNACNIAIRRLDRKRGIIACSNEILGFYCDEDCLLSHESVVW
jgi:hypothetical protein